MREVVSAAFKTAWEAAQPSVPLVLENEALPSSDTFVLMTIAMTSAAQTTHGRVGTRRVRRDGWIQVKLWSPANAGAAGMAGLCDTVRGILEMVSLPSPVAGDDPVTTLAANMGPSGADGRWYMQLVRVPFWFRELK